MGDEISVYADLDEAGPQLDDASRSTPWRATATANGEFEVASGEFTFVALDEQDRPRSIAGQEEKHG